MDKAQLLGTLNELVGRYETHQGFIERARAQQASGKFASHVIEKVVADHSAKAAEVAGLVQPLVPQLQGLVDALRKERGEVETSKAGLDEEVQEFELRLAIGELSEKEFEKAAGALKARLEAANTRIGAIDAELAELDGAFGRWNAVAKAGHAVSAPVAAPPKPEPKPEPKAEPKAAKAEPKPEPKPEPVPEPVVEVKAEPAPEPAPEPKPEPAPVVVAPPEPKPERKKAAKEPEPVVVVPPPEPVKEIPEPVGPHLARTEIKEDISAIFGGDASPMRADEDIAIETSEIVEESAESNSADVQFGFADEVLADAGPAPREVEVDVEPPAVVPLEPKEQPRRALLLYQESTADEQIYPFTGDVLTIGRGRENDIQIKNDSKVSRYHCKLFRRGNNFYIEDVKSSNGTLVNGELITDRRLFGGEEVIIGETFFRFRIMD